MPADAALSPRQSSDAVAHSLVADLHEPRPSVFWIDLIGSAVAGWGAFALATVAIPWSPLTWGAALVAALALYRGLCFTHELTHLRRRALPGFETVWNLLFGVPLLLPSFTYIGVHQAHHGLTTYGTKDDPEYLPFAKSRRLIFIFSAQSSVLIPILLLIRFLIVAPVGLVWPQFHRFLETHASSFSMNPDYRRVMSEAMAQKTRRWELAMLVLWSAALAVIWFGLVPVRTLYVWYGVVTFVSFLNTMRVLGAHDYQSDGTPLDREGQLSDSIDTPGGPWTELWAPVGLRYHALHHYFPGIPYHNLGAAYRRIVEALPDRALFRESTSPSLRHSLSALYRHAKDSARDVAGW